MGIRSGISVFLRPAYYGGIQRTGRPGSREKEIEFDTASENPPGLSDRGALSQNRIEEEISRGGFRRRILLFGLAPRS